MVALFVRDCVGEGYPFSVEHCSPEQEGVGVRQGMAGTGELDRAGLPLRVRVVKQGLLACAASGCERWQGVVVIARSVTESRPQTLTPPWSTQSVAQQCQERCSQ